jgi:outer membrane autotransporter protein
MSGAAPDVWPTTPFGALLRPNRAGQAVPAEPQNPKPQHPNPSTRTAVPEPQRKDENMTSWEFPGAEPIDIFINIAAGSVAVSAEPTDVTTVSLLASRNSRNAEQIVSDVQVTFDQGRLEIIQPKSAGFLRGHTGLDLTVKAPAGSRCTARTASADVACVGELAELEAKTASGDVTAASVSGRLQVNTASGDIWVENAGATVDANTASGDIRVRQAGGDISVDSASGDVSVGLAGGSVDANTASGDVELGSVAVGRASVKTVSGDSVIGVAAGAGVYLDLSSVTGRIVNQLDETDGGEDVALDVTCRSVSGDIRVTRASSSAAR